MSKKPTKSDAPGPASRFFLRPGVRLEPFADGTAILYSGPGEKSASLNHTAALLCTFADGRHSVAAVVDELQASFPGQTVEPASIMACLTDLVEQGFLEWR